MYPRINQHGSTRLSLHPTPGLKVYQEIGTGGIRGMMEMGGVLYVVSGSDLLKISSDKMTVPIASYQIEGTGPVSMAGNGYDLCLVASDVGKGYLYTAETGEFRLINDPDFRTPSTVVFLDGFFIFSEKDTGRVFSSELMLTPPETDPESIFNSLDFATAESDPDNIVAVARVNDQLWLMGAKSIEMWYYDGGDGFPFQRGSGGTIDIGCGAAFSIARADNNIFWLGDDGVVYRTQGTAPQRISTFPIEHVISTYSEISDAVAYTQKLSGHLFYVLSFPTGNATWAYDVATQMWHERQSWPSGRVIGQYHAEFGRLSLVGDYRRGTIYQFDPDCYTENGAIIKRQRTCNVVAEDGRRLFFNFLQLNIESGVGLVEGQGEDPQIMFQWSDDDGRTWSDEVWTSMGKLGETQQRVVFRRLGSSFRRTFRVTITDPVKTVFTNAILDITAGPK